MNSFTSTLKTFVANHKQSFIVGAWVLAIVLFLVALYIYNNPPSVAYKPANACKLFTPTEAEDLLGNHVSNVEASKPIISGDVATSQCGYGDTNPDQNQRKVAAVAIRSGVNDKGVKKNKSDFKASKSNNKDTITAVQSLGDDAYFNHTNGQLNVLNGRQWLIISYGIGAMPQNNTVGDAITLAQLILPQHQPNLPQF